MVSTSNPGLTLALSPQLRGNLQLSPEDQSRCRQHLLDMRTILAHQAAANVAADKLSSSSSTSVGSDVMESSLAALVNLEDWDFLMTLKPEPKFQLLQVSQLVLQLSVVLRGGTITLDIKKACAALSEALRALVSQPMVATGELVYLKKFRLGNRSRS